MLNLVDTEVALQVSSLVTVMSLAFYVGRKAQRIESSIHRLTGLTKVVDEHCARLAAIEAVLFRSAALHNHEHPED